MDVQTLPSGWQKENAPSSLALPEAHRSSSHKGGWRLWRKEYLYCYGYTQQKQFRRREPAEKRCPSWRPQGPSTTPTESLTDEKAASLKIGGELMTIVRRRGPNRSCQVGGFRSQSPRKSVEPFRGDFPTHQNWLLKYVAMTCFLFSASDSRICKPWRV